MCGHHRGLAIKILSVIGFAGVDHGFLAFTSTLLPDSQPLDRFWSLCSVLACHGCSN